MRFNLRVLSLKTPPLSDFPCLEIVTLKTVAPGNPHSSTCERRSWRPGIVLFSCRTLLLANYIISVSTWSAHSGKSSVAVGLCWNLCWGSTVLVCRLHFEPLCCVSIPEYILVITHNLVIQKLPTFLSLGIFSLALRHSVIVKRIHFNVRKWISTGVIGI